MNRRSHVLSDMQSPSYTQCVFLRRDTPVPRCTIRQINNERSWKRRGEGWRFAKRGYMQVLEYSPCPVCVCVILNTNAHICTFKLIKTKWKQRLCSSSRLSPLFSIFCEICMLCLVVQPHWTLIKHLYFLHSLCLALFLSHTHRNCCSTQ